MISQSQKFLGTCATTDLKAAVGTTLLMNGRLCIPAVQPRRETPTQSTAIFAITVTHLANQAALFIENQFDWVSKGLNATPASTAKPPWESQIRNASWYAEISPICPMLRLSSPLASVTQSQSRSLTSPIYAC